MKWVGILALALVAAKVILKILIFILKIIIFPFAAMIGFFKGMLIKDDYDY